MRKGARLITSSWARFPANVMPGKAKVGGNYVNSALAKMEAVAAGADEALLLDEEGRRGLGERARGLVGRNRGAVSRTVDALSSLLA